ncbi:MAG: ABC transporter ATP-binding protein [bacterium]|nr:ABC transporter ATP-binding protein [bacterium]MCP4968342.1 ABC transporter ATP-binding protein [bacterium]
MTTSPALVDNPTVEINAVSKWFGQKVAVSDVTCSFGPGLTGLLGPNGAGKTTLLRMLTGLIRPSQGEVLVKGQEPRTQVDSYKELGFVPEESALYNMLTGQEYVTYGARLSGVSDPERAAKAALEEVGLTADADRPVGGFSKGMRQRTKVAVALVHNPEILILDEPLNGTDPVQRAHLISLFQALTERGNTVIVSSHVLQEVERMTDRVIAIVDGKLAAAGDIAAIRRAMSDIPYRVVIECDKTRTLGAALLDHEGVFSVTVDERSLHIETSDLAGLGSIIAGLAVTHDVRLSRFAPEDESLESVFRYLVGGR